MDLSDLVNDLSQHPAMYTGEESNAAVCAFLAGFDLARDGGPLSGFHEWLVVRARGGNNLHWSGLIKLLAAPDAPCPLSAEQDRLCLEGLFPLLSEFLAYRESVGLTKIHQEYARWLLRQRWYDGPLRGKGQGD
jgi:hypothetical protein